MLKKLVGIIVFVHMLAWAQESVTVAVLDFQGRGISQLEAATLTDRFNSIIANTNAVRLVQRNLMEEILEEQGLQQSGCTTDECVVEVGALLGVQFMINGSIGKIGETFTIDAKMVSVETGATERSKNVTYIGKVDGLITEIEILAWDILGLQVPQELMQKKKMGAQAFLIQQASGKTKFGALARSTLFPGLGQFYSEKKLWGYLWMVSEITVATMGYVSYNVYQGAYDDYRRFRAEYDNATDPKLIAQHRDNAQARLDLMNNTNDQIVLLAYAGAGLWLGNMVHAIIVGPKKNDRAGANSSMQLVYDPNLRQPTLRFTVALD